MAIGKSRKVPKYVQDLNIKDGFKWEPIDSISISISADHRILDGATVIRFASHLKSLLENPNLMLINMS